MDVRDFNYQLPSELIAQHPLKNRDDSRLLVLNRNTGTINHCHFKDLGTWLPPTCTLVLNNTAVIPARIGANRENTGGQAEIFLCKNVRGPHTPLANGGWGLWECLIKTSKAIRVGQSFPLKKTLVLFSTKPKNKMINKDDRWNFFPIANISIKTAIIKNSLT